MRIYNRLQVNLVINPLISMVVSLIWYILLYAILGLETVYAMENNPDAEIIKNAMLARQQGNDIEVRRLLEQLNLTEITDPARLTSIETLLNRLAVEHNVTIDNVFRHNSDTLTLANSGNPLDREGRSWTTILGGFTLFVGISLVSYVIFRNWESIREFLFDVGTQVIDMIALRQMTLARNIGVLYNNPATREVLLNELMVQGFIRTTGQAA